MRPEARGRGLGADLSRACFEEGVRRGARYRCTAPAEPSLFGWYARILGVQPLLLPASVSLPPEDAARIRDNIEILRAMGFGLDSFGGKGEFIVDALPEGLEAGDCRALLADISSGIATAGVRRGSEKWREKAVALGAARAAVPRVAELAPEAMLRLVHDLAATKMPYTSPRGRPTMLFTSLGELARKFNRT